MSMIRMRATDKMSPSRAHRLQYRTRMMAADIMGGSEFEISSADARYLRKAGYAEEVTEAAQQAAPRHRGRPPKGAQQERSEPETAEGDDFDRLSVPELRTLAEKRGLDLPSGYVARPKLLQILRGEEAPDNEDEDDGA
jgi:hypothetical protein